MSEDGLEHIFTGEPQPEVILDVPSVQEFRRRILGRIVIRQVEILRPYRPSKPIESMTDAELIEARRQNEQLEAELPYISATWKGEKKVYDEVLDMIDDMENEAIRQSEN